MLGGVSFKEKFVGFKGTTRWSVRSTSLHLKEWEKGTLSACFAPDVVSYRRI